jgi:hypothetical protein
VNIAEPAEAAEVSKAKQAEAAEVNIAEPAEAAEVSKVKQAEATEVNIAELAMTAEVILAELMCLSNIKRDHSGVQAS